MYGRMRRKRISPLALIGFFYQGSEQVDVYEFLALPIVRDAVNAINGTIITYGQTGAGKTYSMEGPSILECDQQKKGLLPRVVDGLFQCIKSSDEATKYTIKLSMVEIYMEKVRFGPFDLLKDNIQIKESKVHGILLSGVTEVSILDSTEALHSLSRGIANRAVGETLQQEFPKDKRIRTGKLILVDLAGSEKVEKTGAEGKLLDEAKTINKSLSALGNVINALTCSPQGRANHIPYRDSKLTRILQDALGGNSRTALLCCCSPSPSNASESLSTLRFGARSFLAVITYSHKNKTKSLIQCLLGQGETYKGITRVSHNDDKYTKKHGTQSPSKDGSFEDLELTLEDVALRTISSLQEALEELTLIVEELKIENKALKFRLAAAERVDTLNKKAGGNTSFLHKVFQALSAFSFPGLFHSLMSRC
ncbi:Kinesin-like protein KIN-1 [Vitis vinifera]|uniref:Kinesin-like protein n=1 Tax=Vitis vinifera TaxID=29760 RepID=A0A438KC38_VITVI|nr:Kinesin-like protein KIN-1 [Vitis vinifera]